ncbi:MAG: HDOD domain-containing protein [Betaproteobacteria bacterium]|nr:HDOD domain-containing protein [Betaproteobacteria bacterium]
MSSEMSEQTPFCTLSYLDLRVQELPVLRHTRQLLDEAREHMEVVNARDLSRIVAQDPLLAVRMITHSKVTRGLGRALHNEISTIGSSIIMMGVEPFLHAFDNLKSLEEILQRNAPHALLEALKTISRSRNAANYAHRFALWRVDPDIQEITLAALLYDLAEILLYVLEPLQAMKVRAMLKANPGLRSVDAQKEVLGCTLADVQLQLCRNWKLPDLLLQLIDGRKTDNPKVKNVSLAVIFARHLANGWDDPAIPSDLSEIAKFLNTDMDTLENRLKIFQPPEV